MALVGEEKKFANSFFTKTTAELVPSVGEGQNYLDCINV